jgi:hypothetical protein
MKKAIFMGLLVALILVSVLLSLAIVVRTSAPSLTDSPAYRDNHRILLGTGECNTHDYLRDGKLFCFRGNIDLLQTPSVLWASLTTGTDVIFGSDTNGNRGYVALFVEDVGDLGFFWDATKLIK